MQFTITAGQVCILLFFMLIGYILAKTNMVGTESSAMLSTLEFFVFSPALTLKSFISNMTTANIVSKAHLLISACIIVFLTYIGAIILSKAFYKDVQNQRIISYAFTVPNYGYAGFALMGAVYGERMLFNMIIFTIPLTLFCYSEGYRILTGQKGISFKKVLNPGIIVIIIGSIIGVFSIPVHGIIYEILTPASNCMAPVAMILTGITLAEFNLRKMFVKIKSYVIVIFKLIIIPLVMLVILKLLKTSAEDLIVILMVYSMPIGLNTIIFPKLKGLDCELGASIVLISNILSVITIPLILLLV